MIAPAPVRRGRHAGRAALRVLIVDDSIVARTMLAAMIGARPDFIVAGSVVVADAAVAVLATQRIDLIVLDGAMGGMDGLVALPALIAQAAGARVLVLASCCTNIAAARARAIALGASDLLLKPGATGLVACFADLLAERLLRIAAAGTSCDPAMPRVAPRTDPIACLAIGASTGGPDALAAFFGALDPAFVAPILVTQHLPAAFVPSLVGRLQVLAARPIAIAADGVRLAPRAVLVAPGDAHLSLVRHGGVVHVSLGAAPVPSGHCPSIDVMLGAVAGLYGRHGAAMILTGMGRDGAAGAMRLAAAGGEILAQDAASAVVWGMPGAVAARASLVASPAKLARHVSARCVPPWR